MAKAESTRTTRRDLLRFAAAAVPAVFVGTATSALAVSDADLRSLIAGLHPRDAEFLSLRAKFEPLWESLLPIHVAFAEWEGKPSTHPAWDEWNGLLLLLMPIACQLLDPTVFTSTFTPAGFALKAAAVLVTETEGDQLGDRLDWDVAQFMFQIVDTGRIAVPRFEFPDDGLAALK